MSTTRLQLGFTDSTILHPVVQDCVRSFCRRVPGAHLSLVEGFSADLLTRLQAGEIDAALLRPSNMKFSGLQMIHLASEPLLVALSVLNPLARQGEVGLRELADTPLFLPSRQREPAINAAVVELIRRGGPRKRYEHGFPSASSLLARTSLSEGLSIVPQTMSRLSLEGIVYRHIRGSSCTIDIALIVPAPPRQTQTQARFFEAVQSVIEVAREGGALL